ncbi:MAG TPA: zf-HC2 domain-containing protein [Terriglobales bacterium]
MNELPKFVTGRLAQPGGQALVHPDADLLTAFLEQKVTHSEREQVFAHLSQCSSCRDVLNLAAPETLPAASAPGSVKGERTWLRWPGMRWASIAAASVVLLAIGIALRPTLTDEGPSQPATEVVVKSEQAPSLPVSNEQRLAESSNASRSIDSKADSAAAPAAKKPEIARNEIDSSKDRAVALGNRKSPGSVKQAFDKETQAPRAEAKKQIPAANQTVAVTDEKSVLMTNAPAPPVTGRGVVGGVVGGPVAANTLRANQDQTIHGQVDAHGMVQQRKFYIQPQQQTQTQQQAQTQGFVGQQPADGFKANAAPPPGPPPPPTASSLPTTVVAGNAQVPLEEKKEAVAGPLTLDTSRRNTRAKAVIPGFRAGGFGATSLNPGTLKVSSGQAVSWKISSEGKLLRKSSHEDSWNAVQLPSAATLHSLASNDLDVWVGGAPLSGESAGALFHTTDGGEHWQRVNGPWTGDILALEALSANNSVQVRTAGGEWRSQDSGQNWIRTR